MGSAKPVLRREKTYQPILAAYLINFTIVDSCYTRAKHY